MKIGQKLTPSLSHTLSLTPQLLQSIHILQCSNDELHAIIDDACLSNPLLNKAEAERNETFEHDGNDRQSHHDGEPDNFDRAMALAEGPHGVETLSYRGAERPAATPEVPSAIDLYAEAPTDLYRHLHRELSFCAMAPQEAAVAHGLVYALDETGYLTESVADCAERMGVEAVEIEQALRRIQAIIPGVGARDLAECLRAQLQERQRLDPIMTLCLSHLDLLASGDVAALHREGVRLSEEDLRSVLADLRALDPKPGLRFASPMSGDSEPDLIVGYDHEGQLLVRLNDALVPRLIRDETYETRIGQHDQATSRYLRACTQQANFLIRALKQRADTLLRVGEAVVRRQSDFFTRSVGALKPLSLHQVAEQLGVHDSTISRAVANKSLWSSRGTFPLRYFFSHAVGTSGSDEGHAVETVKAVIRRAITAEDHSKPLSDDALARHLQSHGMPVARRTVAKYREAMKIEKSTRRLRAYRLSDLASGR